MGGSSATRMEAVGCTSRSRLLLATLWLAAGMVGHSQTDPQLTEARAWIGRALFLRGFYGANDLKYDAIGKVIGTPKVVDWTLAGMDVQTVERRGPDTIELEGVPVAIRFNPENRFFERHAQKDERIKVTIATTGSAGMERKLVAIFSVGIDPEMQRAMPAYWLHYFQPGAAWPEDGATAGKPVVLDTVAGVPQGVVPPIAEKKVEPKYPGWAERDKVQGLVQMVTTLDELGVSRHVTIARPLGYGLDAEAAEAVGRWRWRPATRDGRVIAATIGVGQEFKLVSLPGR